MSNHAFVLYPRERAPQLRVIRGGSALRRHRDNEQRRLVMLLGAALVLAQLGDAILTYAGLIQFGAAAEGNAFIRALIGHIGIGPSIIVAKSFAVCCLGILCYYGSSLRWVPSALALLLVIHMSIAIVPWTVLLFQGRL